MNALGVLDHALTEVAELVERYFRLEAHGLERIPRVGGALIIANHSGYSGADAIVLCHLIHRQTGRAPRILAHRAFFELVPWVRPAMEWFGLREAGFKEGIQVLERGELLLVFPEAEDGNFKPSSERYHLQRFHTGFVRMALAAHVPIVPGVVLGAEETHLNLGSFHLGSLKLPMPFNLLPLPAKWRIRFLEPLRVALPAGKGLEDRDALSALAAEVRQGLQAALDEELAQRQFVFFDQPGQS